MIKYMYMRSFCSCHPTPVITKWRRAIMTNKASLFRARNKKKKLSRFFATSSENLVANLKILH